MPRRPTCLCRDGVWLDIPQSASVPKSWGSVYSRVWGAQQDVFSPTKNRNSGGVRAYRFHEGKAGNFCRQLSWRWLTNKEYSETYAHIGLRDEGPVFRAPCCVYRVFQEEWTKLWESVPYVELYRYNPKHLYPKLNGYGDNGFWGVHVLYAVRDAIVVHCACPATRHH